MSEDQSSNYIPVDWDNPDLYRQPEAVSRPDLLGARARRAMLEVLGNVKDGTSADERTQTLNAYRSLRPDQASLNLRNSQNAEIQTRLERAFQSDPDLIHLAQNFDNMSDGDVSRSLNKILALQNEVLQGGGARSINYFRDPSPGAPRGEANAGMLGLNMVDYDGKRPPLQNLISTVLHENRHVHQHWLADNADRIPANDPRKSDAEIFKLTFEIRRNNNSIGNGDFTYLDNPVEVDARNSETPSHSPKLNSVLKAHATEGQKIIEENTKKFLASSASDIPADWDRIARETPRPVVTEPEDVWTKAARKAEAETKMAAQPSPQQQFQHQPSQDEIDRQKRFQEARAEWTRPAQSDFAARYAEEFNRLASGKFLEDVPSPAAQAPDAGRFNLKSAFSAAAEHGGKGAVMGLSGYGVATKLGGMDAGYNADINAGGERANYARASVAADTAGFAVDAVESGAHVLGKRAANVAASLENPATVSAVGRMTGVLESGGGKLLMAGVKRAAMPLALAAGGFEVAAAVKAHDPERAAGAVGSTLGGLAAGAGFGAIGGSVGGPPGAVVGAVVGGVAGAIVGEKVAKEVGTNAMAGMMGEKPPEGKETTSYKVGRGIRDAVKPSVDFVKKHPIVLATGPLAPAIAGIGAAVESKAGQAVVKEVKQTASSLWSRGTSMLQSAKESVTGLFTGQDKLAAAATEMSKNQSWVRHADRSEDGKISAAELRRSMAGHGQKEAGADKNHDGRITAKEMTQYLNEGIAAERREIAIDRRGMDKMSADQLRKAIHDDNILPDTVKIGGKQVDITTALKNPAYLDRVADRFEAMHLRGDHDYSKQVAMLRELQERQSGQMIPTQIGPSVAMQLGR